jgi:hypothetical protein
VDEKGEKIIFFNFIQNMINEKINSLDEFEKRIRSRNEFLNK